MLCGKVRRAGKENIEWFHHVLRYGQCDFTVCGTNASCGTELVLQHGAYDSASFLNINYYATRAGIKKVRLILTAL